MGRRGAEKKRLIAETRVLRAYLYYDLTFKYGDVPLVTSEITVEEGYEESQDSHEEVVDFVLMELDEAADVLPETYSGDQEGKITWGTATGLRARFALYEEEYETARDAAREVMDNGMYDLVSEYEDFFTYEHEHSDEVLLANQYVSPDREHNIFGVFAPPSLNGGGTISPLRSLVNAYEMQSNGEPIDDPNSGYDPENPWEDRDPRLDASMIRPGTEFAGENFDDMLDEVDDSFYHTQTGLYVKKYLSEEDAETPDDSGLDLIVLRYAEILLTYAEAKIELGDIDNSVYEAIDEVRTRANMPSIGASGSLSEEELQEAVRHERRVEFAFEGQRFYDIRRWRIAEDVLDQDAYGIDEDGSVDPDTPEEDRFFVGERVFDPDKHYLFAIPEDEIELNDNLEQNQGW